MGSCRPTRRGSISCAERAGKASARSSATTSISRRSRSHETTTLPRRGARRRPAPRGLHGRGGRLRRGALDGECGGRRGRAGPRADRGALRALPLSPGEHVRREAPLRDAPAVRRPRRGGPRRGWEVTSDAARLRPGDACAFVVFGAMGDLTKRKLLPSLYNLRANGLLPADFAFIGVARRPLDDAGFRDHATAAVREFATGPLDDRLWAEFARRIHYVKGDFEEPGTCEALSIALSQVAQEHG